MLRKSPAVMSLWMWMPCSSCSDSAPLFRKIANLGAPCLDSETWDLRAVLCLSRHIAMQAFHLVSIGLQQRLHLLRNHHRAMLAAGAAKRDAEIALAFLHVMRQQKQEQIMHFLNKFLGLGEFVD